MLLLHAVKPVAVKCVVKGAAAAKFEDGPSWFWDARPRNEAQYHANSAFEPRLLKWAPSQKRGTAGWFEYSQDFSKGLIDVSEEHDPEAAADTVEAAIGEGQVVHISLNETEFRRQPQINGLALRQQQARTRTIKRHHVPRG